MPKESLEINSGEVLSQSFNNAQFVALAQDLFSNLVEELNEALNEIRDFIQKAIQASVEAHDEAQAQAQAQIHALNSLRKVQAQTPIFGWMQKLSQCLDNVQAAIQEQIKIKNQNSKWMRDIASILSRARVLAETRAQAKDALAKD